MVNNRAKIYQFMANYYNLEELRDLAIRLGLDIEEIEAGGKKGKVSGILDWAIRRPNKVEQLLDILYQDRRERFIVEDLSLSMEFVEQVYQSLAKSDNSEDKNLAPKILDMKLSRAKAQQRIKNLFWKMLWIRTSWLKQVDVDKNLQLKYWPVFIYQGDCYIKYSFQQFKIRSDINSTFKRALPDHSVMQNHPFQQKTKNLYISEVSNLPITMGSPGLLDLNHTNVLSQVVSGRKSKYSFSNSLVTSTTNLLYKSAKPLKLLIWRAWDEINTGIYDNPSPRWPKLNSSRRFIASIGLPQDIASHQNSNNLTEQVMDFETNVKGKLESSVANKNFIEITEITFSNKQIHAIMLPFWALDTEVEGNRLTILVNGWNGGVAYIYSPFFKY